MPIRVDKLNVPRELDRRVKLSLDEIKLIREMYESGEWSLNKLAKKFNVSKKTILLYVNDESMRKNKQYIKDNWRHFMRSKEERAHATRRTRNYKKSIFDKLI